MFRRFTKSSCYALALAGVVGFGALTMAAEPPAKTPAKTAAPKNAGPRPLLKQLNEETQSLYRELQSGVCRIQLPPPRWAGAPLAEQENPVNKWGKELDPAVKQALEAEQHEATKGQYRKITASVTTGAQAGQAPASKPTSPQGASQGQTNTGNGAWTLSSGPDDVLIFRPGSSGAGSLQFDAGGSIARDGTIVGHGGRVQVNVVPGGSFTPNNMALVIDGEGHLLVPICVEKEQFNNEPVRVMVGPGQMSTARFVGSDRQCNITVLKLEKPLGTPVKFAEGRPTEGALTMFLAPNSGVGRLLIWTNELRDWGVVSSMEGGIFGFTRQGQFLSLAACRPAVDQLLKTGEVKRAKMGVAIVEVAQNDAARETSPVLGTQPAVRVSEIAPNSPAAKAGLKVGDLILSLNDQPIGDPSSFGAAMSDPNPKATVKLLRDGEEKELTCDLAGK